MKASRFQFAGLGMALALGLGVRLPAAVVVSNLDQATFSTAPVSTAFWFGNRFVTDGSAVAFSLQSVTLGLGAPMDTSSGLLVAIYADLGSQPGLRLETLAGAANPATGGDYTYTSTGLGLAPNTSYWLVAGVPTGAGNYSWEVTESNLFTGSWTIPSTATHIYSFNQGAVWQPAQDGFPRQFSVSATAVPEPATGVLLAFGAAGWMIFRRRRASRD